MEIDTIISVFNINLKKNASKNVSHLILKYISALHIPHFPTITAKWQPSIHLLGSL